VISRDRPLAGRVSAEAGQITAQNDALPQSLYGSRGGSQDEDFPVVTDLLVTHV